MSSIPQGAAGSNPQKRQLQRIRQVQALILLGFALKQSNMFWLVTPLERVPVVPCLHVFMGRHHKKPPLLDTLPLQQAEWGWLEDTCCFVHCSQLLAL